MHARRWTAVSVLAMGLAGLLLVAAAPTGEKAGPGDAPAAEPEVRVLEITLEGAIPETARMTMPFRPRPALLRDYTASIRKAAKDETIQALILRTRQPALGLAKLQELADAIGEFKAAGKRVYSYAAACENGDYMLACSADRIVAAPGAMILLTGLRAEALFFKKLLDWAGIKADLIATGVHKSAGDAYTRDSMSEENRKVLNELLDDVYGQFVAAIAKGRGQTPEKIRETIDQGPFTAADAKARGLVDEVAYYDEFVATVGKELGGKVDLVKSYHRLGERGPELSEMNLFSLFASLAPRPAIPATPRPKVVIIYASGVIAPKRSFLMSHVITAEQIGEAFATARKDDTVKAVVLRIDSPGGSALISDLIWREVQRTRAAGKPVVASMSDVAASGGYYIAMGADAIVAQPATLTGSIGVLGGKLNLHGLYDKLHINKEIFTRGKNAALFSDYTDFTPAERVRVKALIDGIYEDFVAKAAQGRGMAPERMRQLATGRVWTARAAKEAGLVDALGGLKEAYELAIEKAGIQGENVQPVVLPREKSLLEALLGTGAHARPTLSGRPLPSSVLSTLPYLEVMEVLARENALAIMPYFIEIR